ncbi:MAG: TonB-dependent receptor [Wenzhouxiangellaceae bacterium]
MNSFAPTRAKRVLSLLAVWLLVMGAWAPLAVAQQTSADLRGFVTDSSGNGISGARVEIVHVPSGTVAVATTGGTGAWFQSGLRVGGPYRITATAEGYQGNSVENLFLKPGSNDPQNFSLVEAAMALENVSVTGVAISEAAALNFGVGSTYTARDIANQPSTDRDVIRTLLRDPLAQSDGVGNLSVGGVNPRFNSFAIDGATQTDAFGLSTGTYATSRSPINLDAVESVSLVAADYSVIASDFTGGKVNIVTKSGTNEFDGNVYYAYKDDSFVGDKSDGRSFDPGNFEEKEYGFTLGGPILKDKLFFFVSYDEYENAAPVDFTNADLVNGVQPGFFDGLRQAIINTYGFDPGTRPQVANVPETSERLLVKLDWNINLDHRASFTYQKTDESDVAVSATSFTSAWYDTPLEIEAWTGQLFSNWTYNFSTNLRVNYTEFTRGQNCRAGAGIGQISLDFFTPDAVAGSPLEGLLTDGASFTAGCDVFRHANEFSDERLEVFASGEYLIGSHVITFGAELDNYSLFNLFVPSSRGEFTFRNYDQLVNRFADNVFVSNVPSGNVRDGAAEWEYDLWAFFVQDRWAITPDLEISAGIRYETFSQDDRPEFSDVIFDTYGRRSDNNLDGNNLIMPRFGFLWTPLPRTAVSGGFGLFAGGNPQVWISNAFQKPVFGARIDDVPNVDPRQIPQELLDAIATGQAAPIDIIDPNFDTPSDWKASLRFEQGFDFKIGNFDLGDNYRFTAQALWTKTKDGFNWVNLAQTELADALPTGVAPDGRPIYADLNALGLPNLTMLTNNNGAESLVLTFGLAKQFDNGFNFDISYAYTDAEIVSEGTSSRGISNWRGIFAVDRNFPDPRTSPFQIQDSFKINLGYERNLIADLQTRVDVFGRIFRGDVWSTTFDVNSSNALFGRAGSNESPFDNNPLYIPLPGNDPRVVYASSFDVQGFFEYIERNNIPTGQIHDPYSEQVNDWNNIWDLRFQQELPGLPFLDRFVGDNRFKLILDIDNFLNLIDSDWGKFVNGPGFGQARIVQADIVSAADVAANGVDGATALTGDAPRTTCLQQGDCLFRYRDFDNDPTEFHSLPNSVYEIRLTLRYDF